jgi:hypothetical protein
VAGASTSQPEVSAAVGDSTTVSALAALPPLAEAPPRVVFGLEPAASAIGGDLNDARASLRLVRQRLGASGSEAVYGFRVGTRPGSCGGRAFRIRATAGSEAEGVHARGAGRAAL